MNTKDFIKNLKVSYDSGFGDNLGKDFYSPCLDRCKEYKRMTGEFTSNVIFDWGRALLKVLNNEEDKCMVKIIANPSLNQYDIDTLRGTLQHRNDDEFWEKLSDQIYEEAENLVNKDLDRKEEREVKLKIFAYLISTNKLNIKFAFPKHVPSPGMFHVKKGIFYFEDDLKVGFNGGPNESHGGHELNIEGIDVFHNCDGENPHIKDSEEKFDLAWEGDAPGFLTKTLSQKTLNKIKINAPSTKIELNQIIKKAYEKKKDTLGDLLDEEQIENLKRISTKNEIIKENIKLWPHQEEAVNKFLKVKSGILEMATGTGKTKTSLEILKILTKENKINSCIISTDGNTLLDQWYQEILKFHPIIKNTIKKIFRHYGENNTSDQYLSNPDNSLLVISRQNLQKFLPFLNKEYKKNIFIIHDEVHGFGSPANIKNLKGTHKDFIYKLGMSATPEREYEDEGNTFISDEIGNVFYEFKLEDAIKAGVLCKMDYVTEKYFLSDDEKNDIKNLIKAHHAKKAAGEKVNDNDLYTRIAAVRKNAESKIGMFADYIKKNPEIIKNTIIFVYSKARGNQISEILQGKVKYREFFDNDVNEHLDYFAKGELDCLVTCHRLSQGIDIQGLKNVILVASDRSKLETIQRIGRCLRKNKNDPFKKAKIFDFIDPDYDADKQRAEWLNTLSKI